MFELKENDVSIIRDKRKRCLKKELKREGNYKITLPSLPCNVLKEKKFDTHAHKKKFFFQNKYNLKSAITSEGNKVSEEGEFFLTLL